jgi:hypothetical protein
LNGSGFLTGSETGGVGVRFSVIGGVGFLNGTGAGSGVGFFYVLLIYHSNIR